MGSRRSPEKVKSTRDWRAFVAHNQAIIEAAGLSLIVMESVDHWDDFLSHGILDHHDDPTSFSVDRINEPQYKALVQLVESYFGSGYDYFTPIALRYKDQLRMYDKFDKK
jgi:hypothetical protein